MRRATLFPYVFLSLLVPLLAFLAWQPSTPAQAGPAASPTPVWQLFFPGVMVPLPTPTHTPSPTPTPTSTPAPVQDLVWDPRLDLRGAVLVPAAVQPGQGYWKIVSGVWFDVTDPKPMGVGDHDIAFDVTGASGSRIVSKNLAITYDPSMVDIVTTQAKPGEPYAGTYPMYHIAPMYNIQVDDGSPSDRVSGLGMGSIQYPALKIHTSYAFIWRWTVAPTSGGTPTPTATPAPPSGLVWDPRLTQRGAAVVTAQPQPGQGYWKLVQAQWYDVTEQPFANQGLILVDTKDAAGNRQTGVTVQLFGMDGTPLGTVSTEAKLGELYAANFGMSQPAPSYRAAPGGAPADMLTGMGLGTLSDPAGWELTRYGLMWQWTVAPAGPSPAHPATAPLQSPADLPAAPGSPLFRVGLLAPRCAAAAGAPQLSGSLLLGGTPASGYRIVYSAAPDGSWGALPAEAGPQPAAAPALPGIYRLDLSLPPAGGEWYVWVVDGSGFRVSLIVPWRPVDGCDAAILSFSN